MPTGSGVELLADAVGFICAVALAWQERAERTAQALEQLISRWDAV